MKTFPKDLLNNCSSHKVNIPSSEKEVLKRTKTYNPKRENAPYMKTSANKETYSNSFCADKRSPEEKIMTLKEVLSTTQNELYEALAAEFKLKESMIGLEKHAMKLQMENKILHKNRRESVNNLTVIGNIMNELIKIKKENSELSLQSKQMREGAIDALVEKEKKIFELSEQIESTEQFYKLQLDQAREEIKFLQENIKTFDLKGFFSLEKQKTQDLEINLTNERRELLQRIEFLQGELEEKEKENKQNLLNLEKSMNDDMEKKINEQLKIMLERDYKLMKNSMNILEQAEEKSDHYEIICFNLQEKIKSIEIEHNKEILEIKLKNEQIISNHTEIIEHIKENYEKRIEELKKESQKEINDKNEYIIKQEKSKDDQLNRISDLEAEMKKKIIENSKLLDNIIALNQKYLLMQNKLEETATKQEDYIKDLSSKFNNERQLLKFELKHMKKLTMDDSLLGSRIPVRKSSDEMGRKRTKTHEKRNSTATRPYNLQKLLNHSTSLGLEISNQKDLFEFNNHNIKNVVESIMSSPSKGVNSKIMKEEENEEDDTENELRVNFANSLDIQMNLEDKFTTSEKRFSIPNEPIEPEGILKNDGNSSESDMSEISTKMCFCDKSVQVNRDVESLLEQKKKPSKEDLFDEDYELCKDKQNNTINNKNEEKVEVDRDKFVEKSSKISYKNDNKFFLMENDSDESPSKSKMSKLSKMDKSSHNSSLKFNKSKSDKTSDDKNSQQFYLDDFEKKLNGIINLVSDFLRNFKESNIMTNGPVFDSSKKNKFYKIHSSLTEMMNKLNRDESVITHELLKKTMIKFDAETLKTLNYHKFIAIIFEGYTHMNEGHVEYNINLEDVLMKKTWKFQMRYSKIRNFHKECQSFLNSIKLDNGFIGSLPPFPPKKWFGNTEDEFLKTRQKDLEKYFQTIMTSPLCVHIIEKGIFRYFLYNEIWKHENEELSRKFEKIEKWETINKLSIIQGKDNNDQNINFEKLGLLIKDEINKINAKLEIVKGDLLLLEKNECLSILRYEEKRKKAEKEFNVRESFNENDFKGLL